MFYFSNLPTWLYLLHYLAWGIVLLTIFISWNLGFGEDKVSIGEFVLLGGASFVSMAIIVATAIIYFSLGLGWILLALIAWAVLAPNVEDGGPPVKGPYLGHSSQYHHGPRCH